MAKRKTKSDRPPVAKTVLSRFHLSEIRLLRSATSLSLRSGPLPSKTATQLQCNIGANKDERKLLADVECHVQTFYDKSSKETPAILITCAYQAVYECKSKRFPSAKAVKADHQIMVAAALSQTWPFIRQYVAWASTQMGLPALKVGMLTHDFTTGQLLLEGNPLAFSQRRAN